MAYGITGVTDLPTSLGEEFVRLFVAIKRHEIAKARTAIASFDAPDFNDTVDPWERDELFEFL